MDDAGSFAETVIEKQKECLGCVSQSRCGEGLSLKLVESFKCDVDADKE